MAVFGWKKRTGAQWTLWDAYRHGKLVTGTYVRLQNDGTHAAYVDYDKIGERKTLRGAKALVARKARIRPDPPCPPVDDWDDMPRPTKRRLCTPQGPVDTKRLGKGSFTEARVVLRNHQPTDEVLTFTPSHWAMDKDILVMAREVAPAGAKKYLPKLSKVGTTQRDESVYKMPRYKTGPSDRTPAGRIRKRLEELNNTALRQSDWRASPYNRSYDFNEAVQADRMLPRGVKDAIGSLLETSTMYGDQVGFEFPKRNTATKPGGSTLILMDPVFDVVALKQVRARKERARRKAELGRRRGWW